MRRLLVAAILLSTAMSDKNPTKDRQEASYRLAGKQFWSRRGKRVPRDTIRIDFDDFLGTSLFTKAIKLPFPGAARHAESNTKHLQNNPNHPSSEDVKHRIVKPMLLLSVDFRDLLDQNDQFPSKCNSGNCHFRDDGWKLQKPMYVDEPSWIEIEADYTDHVPHYVDSADPFVLSRGKKIQIFKSPIDAPPEESSTGYEGLQDIRKKIRSPTTNSLTRSKRSMRLEKYEGKRNNEENTDVEKKDDDNESVKSAKEKLYTADLENYEDPFFLSRGKKMHTERDEYRIKFEGEEDDSGYYPGDQEGAWFFAVNEDRRFKRSLPSFDFKQEDIDEDNFNDSTKEPKESMIRANANKESLISQIVNEVLQNRSDNVALNKRRNLGHNKFDKMDLRSFYMQLKKRDNLKDNDHAKPISWKDDPFERQGEKQIAGEYNPWCKNIPKTGEEYSQERVKHSDILKILEQPYIISRGKKDNGERNAEISFDEEQDENEGLASTLVLKEILKRLSESLRSISEQYVDNRNKVVKKKIPRDRRGVLDELLAKYDPYYVARGKRINVDNPLAKIRGVLKSEMNSVDSFHTRDKTEGKGETLM